MKNFKNALKSLGTKLVKDESGQGAAEYILLIALVVAIIMMFGPKIKEMIKGKTESIEGQFNTNF